MGGSFQTMTACFKTLMPFDPLANQLASGTKYCSMGPISANRKIGTKEDEIRRITLDTNMTL